MKRLVFALVALAVLSAIPAFAQNVTPKSKFEWTQDTTDLAAANALVYRVYEIDAVGTVLPPTTGTVIQHTCTGATSPFPCTAPVTAFTPGSHRVVLTASLDGEASPHSLPATFRMIIAPNAPTALKVTP